MKATIKFKDYLTRSDRQKTITVNRNEPCHIIREFITMTGYNPATYIKTVKCGRIEYKWNGIAREAGAK